MDLIILILGIALIGLLAWAITPAATTEPMAPICSERGGELLSYRVPARKAHMAPPEPGAERLLTCLSRRCDKFGLVVGTHEQGPGGAGN